MKLLIAKTLTLAAALLFATVPSFAAQKADSNNAVPQYNRAAEATFAGTVLEVINRQCPMSGGIGSHLIVKLSDGKVIEVHLAAAKFLKNFDLAFNKGEKVDIVGMKLQFEGKETIFAREVTRGSETFVFRDKTGAPIW
jgi:hypothetical protein